MGHTHNKAPSETSVPPIFFSLPHSTPLAMSNVRPGTVDYSRFETLAAEVSDSDEEQEKFPHPRDFVPDAPPVHDMRAQPSPPAASGSTRVVPSGPTNHRCAYCSRRNVSRRCARCRKVWYCDTSCQRAAWPNHVADCFEHDEHKTWWGIFGPEGKKKQGATTLEDRAGVRRAAVLRRTTAARAAAAAEAQRQAAGGKGGGKGGKGEQEKEETCPVCLCEFTVSGDSGEGISCPSSHHMCSECSGVFVSSIMGDLEASHPPKCPLCRAVIPSETFERQLDSKQLSEYTIFVADKTLGEGEHMCRCEECDYYEIRTDSPTLWICKQCLTSVCLVCNKKVPRLEDEGIVEGDDEYERRQEVIEEHLTLCATLKDAKRQVEDALEAGHKMPCPACGLAGMKDDACLHMTCTRCHTPWCYLCGKSVRDCDKARPRPGRPADDIFLHNVDWQNNEKRCPMYLTQILEVDPGWLGDDFDDNADEMDREGQELVDDQRCLQYFHRRRTIKLLQEVRDRIGARAFAQTWERFDSVKNAGFSLQDVLTTDIGPLIDRDAWDAEFSDEDDSYDPYSEEEDEFYEEEDEFYEAEDEEAQLRALHRAASRPAVPDDEEVCMCCGRRFCPCDPESSADEDSDDLLPHLQKLSVSSEEEKLDEAPAAKAARTDGTRASAAAPFVFQDPSAGASSIAADTASVAHPLPPVTFTGRQEAPAEAPLPAPPPAPHHPHSRQQVLDDLLDIGPD